MEDDVLPSWPGDMPHDEHAPNASYSKAGQSPENAAETSRSTEMTGAKTSADANRAPARPPGAAIFHHRSTLASGTIGMRM